MLEGWGLVATAEGCGCEAIGAVVGQEPRQKSVGIAQVGIMLPPGCGVGVGVGVTFFFVRAGVFVEMGVSIGVGVIVGGGVGVGVGVEGEEGWTIA